MKLSQLITYKLFFILNCESSNVCFLCRTNTEVVADEGGKAVFLTVSRSNGLESSVSVEWETQSDTASASGETNK